VPLVKREVVATGKTVEDAINKACEMLGADRESVEVDILELPTKRLLGLLGAQDAKVKVICPETPNERAKDYLKTILEKMELSDVEIEESEDENGITFNLKGEDPGIIIGHRGETLDAIQYLVSLVSNRDSDEYKRITIDTGDYRKKRETTLNSLAKRIAQNSVRTHRNTTLEPMNPYERRIIHTAVQEVAGATSWSVGIDPNRRVVIGVEGSQRNQRTNYRAQR
jgi:spoIIIJ-associated protein